MNQLERGWGKLQVPEKLQAPNSREDPSSKFQTASSPSRGLQFGTRAFAIIVLEERSTVDG
jgi:hypothetical protein